MELEKWSFDEIQGVIRTPIDPKDVIFKPADEVAAAVEKFKEEFKHRSFSGRHPELGKMINCAVCGDRHRSSIKCQQRFAIDFIDENVETGAQDITYRVAPRTKKGVHGAAQFKGRRIKPHLNKRAMKFIERVRKIFKTDAEPESPLFAEALKIARTEATRQLRAEAREERRRKNRQRKISRRINNENASTNRLRIRSNRNSDGTKRSTSWVRHVFKIGKPSIDRANNLLRRASVGNGEVVQQKEG